MITVHKITVHAVVKEQHKEIQPNEIRDEVIDPSHAVAAKLLKAVIDMYGSKAGAANYGVFAGPDQSGPFPARASNYLLLEEPTDEQFQDLTIVAMNELHRIASLTPSASGGFIMFADYAESGGRYFVVVMIKSKQMFRIQDLNPEELQGLDTSKIHQAARISVKKYHEYQAASDEERQQMNYLSFVSPLQHRPTAEYFIAALGCTSGSASRRATQNLITESQSFLSSSEQLKQYAQPFRDSLMAYLNQKIRDRQPVSLIEVGELYRHQLLDRAEDADELVNDLISALNSEDIAVPYQFPPNRTVVTRHTKIKAQGSGWKLEFDRQKLGEEPTAAVYYDRENHSITFHGLTADTIEDIESALQNPSKGE